MAKALVTGASGFVGGWLCRRLLDEGHELRVLARKSSDLRAIGDGRLERVEGDIVDAEAVGQACRDVDVVFHLAGLVAYRRSDREKMEAINVGGTRNVIHGCLSANVSRLVHMSSVVAVGASFSEQVTLNEDSAYNVAHLNLGYFETKRRAEIEVLKATQEQGLQATVVNPSTIYGPGDSLKASRGVQLKVAKGKFPFFTQGGVNVVAIEDVIEGLLRAWDRGQIGERYILANENLTIKQLFGIIATAAGKSKPWIYLPTPVVRTLGIWGDKKEALGGKALVNSENAWTSTLYHWFSSKKAQNDLGMTFRSSEEAVVRSVEWSKRHGIV